MLNALKKVALGILVLLVILLIWLPGVKASPFRASADKIYTEQYIDGYNYILTFKSAIDLSIYQYRVDSDGVVYGKRTDYIFSGKYYQHLFWNFYLYPESSLLFWNNIRFLDEDMYDYARISMEATETILLNCQSNRTIGRFTEDVCQIDDYYIKLGQIVFTDAEDEELKFAKRVIELFERDGISADSLHIQIDDQSFTS